MTIQPATSNEVKVGTVYLEGEKKTTNAEATAELCISVAAIIGVNASAEVSKEAINTLPLKSYERAASSFGVDVLATIAEVVIGSKAEESINKIGKSCIIL